MKRLKLIVPMTLLLAFFCTNVNAASMKLGYVRLLQAMYESSEGKATLEYLKKEAKTREDEVAKKRDALVVLRNEIEEKSSVWNKETRDAKVEVFQMKDDELVRLVRQHTDEFNKKKQENENRLEEELKVIVRKVAKKNGYTHIIDTSLNILLVMPKGDDITDKVIKAYDESKAKEKK